jgi:hypothetical protein
VTQKQMKPKGACIVHLPQQRAKTKHLLSFFIYL